MQEKKAKIVCLVPSWTETLLECNVNVVGRTRFCIHPAEKIKKIKAVGGTKSMDLSEIVDLEPDYVILDQEENNKEMADKLTAVGIKLIVSHVTSIETAAQFLSELSQTLNNPQLKEGAEKYRKILKSKVSRNLFFRGILIDKNAEPDFNNMNYVIWKDPFMLIGLNTFIMSVFATIQLKFKIGEITFEKYPKVSETDLKKTYCLFSSEPYPFAKDFQNLTKQGFKGALIDGEKVSWYGIRNINFLLSCLE